MQYELSTRLLCYYYYCRIFNFIISLAHVVSCIVQLRRTQSSVTLVACSAFKAAAPQRAAGRKFLPAALYTEKENLNSSEFRLPPIPNKMHYHLIQSLQSLLLSVEFRLQ